METAGLSSRFCMEGWLASGCNGDFQDAIAGVCKQVIGFFNLVKLETVGDQLLRIDPSALDDIEQPSHPFFATRTQCGDNGLVS